MKYEPLRQMLLKCVYCSVTRTIGVCAWQLCSIYLITRATLEAVYHCCFVSQYSFFFLSTWRPHFWSCLYKGLPQFARRNSMEILSVSHLTWNSVRALEACFHVALQKDTFWGLQRLRHIYCSCLSKERASLLPSVGPCYTPGQGG